ncbi:MAG TPA: SOS response-associated peptidase [Steroidobacteraceae bacterium]
MCRCYVSPDGTSIEREFMIAQGLGQRAANFNTTPSQSVPAIRASRGASEALLMIWGSGGKHGSFNVPIEGLATNAASRAPWKEGRRCIVPAMGFYEWHVDPGGSKQPYYIHLEDQDVFGFAGLWSRSRTGANTVTEFCSLITLPANSLMAEVDNARGRVPAILKGEQRHQWLFGAAEAAASALSAYADERMVAYAVSTRVDSPRNNDESLLEPLQTDVD